MSYMLIQFLNEEVAFSGNIQGVTPSASSRYVDELLLMAIPVTYA